jgi:peptidoglycan/xylan/chitin deacetylase (PgdA/CDA1 family)
MNQELVTAILRNHIPALGLVTEGRTCTQRPQSLEPVLKTWLDAGLELGNHTYSHRDFNRMPLEDFEKDVIRGEQMLKPMLAARGKSLRYFRFPFLHTGNEMAKKRAIESFLKKRGYEHAVVTIDNDEYIYAAVYMDALRRDDKSLAKRIAIDYIRYMESMFAFYERFSRETFAYEPPQILLLHDYQLNADNLDDLAAMMKRRGYSFITIGEALRDPIYRRSDNYTGGQGLSWLLRWAPGNGAIPKDWPDVSPWVAELYRRR